MRSAALATDDRRDDLFTALLTSKNHHSLQGPLEMQAAAADSVDHDPAPGQAPGPRGYRDMFTELRTAFSDLHIGTAGPIRS